MALEMPEHRALGAIASTTRNADEVDRPVNPHTLAITSTVGASTAAFSAGVRAVRLVCPLEGVFYTVGPTPQTANASATWLPANTVEKIGVDASDVLHVIGSTSSVAATVHYAELPHRRTD